MYKKLCLLVLSLPFSATLLAQTIPTAEGGGSDALWVGAEISSFNPDYGCMNSSPFSCWGHHLIGISPYVDTRPMFFNRVSVEGQARFFHWGGPGGPGFMTVSSYMIGPRVRIYHFKPISLSGKFLMGNGRMTLSNGDVGNGSYLAYAPGILVDYKLRSRLMLRADYEQQFWPSYKGMRTATTTGTGGLTPNGLSLGFSYAMR